MRTLILILIVAFNSCKTNQKVAKDTNKSEPVFTPQYTPGPQALVYKTKANYNNLVPVLLSEDKLTIVSYPNPSDIKIGDSYPFPTILNSGYLLDNRGIGLNAAFLKLTYEEYSKLKNPPSLKEMYELLIDKGPLTELCDCGNKKTFSDITRQINNIIDEKKLRTICKTLK